MIETIDAARIIAQDRANRADTVIFILKTNNGYMLSSLAFLPQLYAEYVIESQEEVWPINDMLES